MIARSRVSLRLATLVLVMVGCQEGVKSPGHLVPVSGTVNYNGEPVEEAMVTFIPEQGPRASGLTGPDGSFKLTTNKPNDGAIEGTHRVTIEKRAPVDPDNPYTERQWMIPERYSSVKDSGLTAAVGDEDNFEFNLVDEKP